MLGKWKSDLNKGKTCYEKCLINLWKTFHRFIKSFWLYFSRNYGFILRALRLIHSCFTNRKQRTRVNGRYSFWEEILFGVPQRSLLWPLLFNTFLSDLFLIAKETSFASYADENTPYVTDENLYEVIKSLEKDSIKLFQSFSENQMKINHDKCHLLFSGKNNVTINTSVFRIKKHWMWKVTRN